MPEQSKEGPPNRKSRRAANAKAPDPGRMVTDEAKPDPKGGKLTMTLDMPGKQPLVATFDGVADVATLTEAVNQGRASLYTQLINSGLKG